MKNHEKSPKIMKNHEKSPKITKNMKKQEMAKSLAGESVFRAFWLFARWLAGWLAGWLLARRLAGHAANSKFARLPNGSHYQGLISNYYL